MYVVVIVRACREGNFGHVTVVIWVKLLKEKSPDHASGKTDNAIVHYLSL